MLPNITPVGGNDPLQQLRLAGIFGQNPPPNMPGQGMQGMPPPIDLSTMGAVPQMGSMGPQMGSIGPEMGGMEGYEPSTGASDFFQQLLGDYPSAEGPGIMKKIAASLLALKDPRLAMAFMNQPTREQREWQQQIGPAQAAMTSERMTNNTLRMIADSITRGGQADVRLGQAGERITQTGERQAETARHNQATEALALWKSQHPNYQLKTGDDGMIVGINPQNPQDVQPTGVNSGDMSDQQKIDAGVEAAETKAGFTGAQQRETERLRQTGRTADITQREELRRTRPPSARAGAVSLEERRAEANRAQTALLEHPEWKDWITVDLSSGEVDIEEPKTGHPLWGRFARGPSKEEYDQMLNAIQGESVPTDTGRSDSKRQRAITQLEADGKPVNETTIQWMMNKLQ